MARIPDHIIDRINSEADLIGIFRRHTTLKPSGMNHKGCCPFHQEKTPSFFVLPSKGTYHCFGCGEHGRAINAVMKLENMNFLEAVNDLAQKLGIDLPKEDNKQYTYQRNHSNKNTPDVLVVSANTPPEAPVDFVQYWNNIPDNVYTEGDFEAQSAPDFAHLLDTDLGQIDTPNNAPCVGLDPIGYDGADIDYDTHNTNAQAPVDKQALWANYGNTDSPILDTQKNAQAFDSTHLDGTLFGLLNALCQFYQSQLQANPVAYRYFTDRGLSAETIAYFGLGFAPSGWQHLEQAFPDDIAGLKILGLVREGKNNRSFDLLRERVIFPIKDKQGRVVGFAGRALDDSIPKYINSSDSVVFNKQQILYGYHEARQAKARSYLVVEGYMDVIALWQAGVYGAVAPMGTAMNEQQIASLLRLNNTLTLCFDGDNAGQKAAMRTLDVAMNVLEDGKSLKFLSLPSEHDPDSYIKAYGAQAMTEAIHRAISMSEYLYTYLASRYDLSLPEQKAAAMAQLKTLTNKLPKGSSFRYWLHGDMYQRLRAKERPKPTNHTATTQTSAIDELLLCLLYRPQLAQDNPLHTIYQNAQMIDDEAAPLPSWNSLSPQLHELIAAMTPLLPYLNDTTDRGQIDAQAHMILSAICDESLQTHLGKRWRDFFHNNQTHHIGHIEFLFTEVLAQVVSEQLTAEQLKVTGLRLACLYKKRLMALDTWRNNWMQQLQEQVG